MEWKEPPGQGLLGPRKKPRAPVDDIGKKNSEAALDAIVWWYV
jgi:hypothetical protein